MYVDDAMWNRGEDDKRTHDMIAEYYGPLAAELHHMLLKLDRISSKIRDNSGTLSADDARSVASECMIARARIMQAFVKIQCSVIDELKNR